MNPSNGSGAVLLGKQRENQLRLEAKFCLQLLQLKFEKRKKTSRI